MSFKIGVLLVNLGTPDSPSTADVRKYLVEFLSDPRVIDIPDISRFFLVRFIIAPFRAPKSAALYKQIWSERGSPLLYYTQIQRDLLQAQLGDGFKVEFAMRYQEPPIERVLEKFRSPTFKKLIVLPLFPQYASASTGSVQEEVMRIISRWNVIPEISIINSFFEDQGFIHAFAERGRKYLNETYDHFIFSFHGLPERQIRKADGLNHCLNENCCAVLNKKNSTCYRAQSYQTARLIAGELKIPAEKYTVSFQSRLGKNPWIKPYTDEIIKERGQKNEKRLLVFAPAFVSDCLETIYEIGVEYDVLFKKYGGEKIQLVESLNDSAEWIAAMKKLIISS